ncbi:chitin synthase-domain-containing protein [Vararia minispora EC-137]|uniref:Chitin synthase-domain-containing protein n=1 Tax=Vararia minispora EC-137 TaxID=1314806 RepID=A0ACB8QUA9_9AGAM|nr:chitin synthase-domain-containing protein [Vararia minispora EC-137]
MNYNYNYPSQRPPRAARPSHHSPAPSDPPGYQDPPSSSGPAAAPYPSSFRPPPQPVRIQSSVSFQNTERGDRTDRLDQPARARQHSAYRNIMPNPDDPEAQGPAAEGVLRKKSLVRPDREKIDPSHRQWHYRTHAAQLESTDANLVQPSTTGNVPQREGLRRGRSLLARDQDVHESGLALFKRGATLRRKRTAASASVDPEPTPKKSRGCFSNIPGPHDGWVIYCYILTGCVPNFFLKAVGIRTPEQQRAWREKMGLISVILILMAGVGFLTFGFTKAVCPTPPNRFQAGSVQTGSVIIHGYAYDLSQFNHPKIGPFDGTTNPLFVGNWNAAGNDISFMFQNTGGPCSGIITKASSSNISDGTTDAPGYYFPCNVIQTNNSASVNSSSYGSNINCHLSSTARSELASRSASGQVYYTWDMVLDSSKNLAVFESTVIDFNLLNWLSKSEISYPSLWDELKSGNGTYNTKDISMPLLRLGQRKMGQCLEQTIGVGFIDTRSIGCVASSVVLVVSLVFIIGVVAIRFAMAVIFAWFFAHRIGAFDNETREQRNARMRQIENWSNDIYRPAPGEYRPNVAKNGAVPHYKKEKKTFLPTQSRFTPSENLLKGVGGRPTTAYGMLSEVPYKRGGTTSVYGGANVPGKGASPFGESRSSTSVVGGFVENQCPFPLHNVVPQPAPDYEPFGFPLAHTICLVTAYSESVEGLRTTLDSLATTDYPNSHKLILVIADGMVKGAGNDKTTPEICLEMMRDFIIEPEDVEAHSYVAIADGHKRHNMAKVYAGFYDYDPSTVERSKQQRVPMVLVAKTGNPLEQGDRKPGNRGKRDSQIVLMAFLQKVMFDERMTTFEYEFFNSIWRVTGVSPDRYELALCVDADTKVFPDSLTRMAATMVQDEEIMGLCGETKIANKGETWVTMIQVFEYYISHHMTKAFESMFGGVTMYRIKAPKGDSGYWVPILANPDIVERYSENVVDTLHKKNLLLLGEDRYLTTLLLKTFPKRKNIFCPSAVCKTVVPDTFRVLLSQRRRWINSTVHNLLELVLVRDLCGTFCFSMQFVVSMELAGTLVLPAAISFTLYLIIDAAIPGGSNDAIPLALLGIVLGLPGLLIIITTRKVSYVGWMLVYLLSLPIWNGILPAYAYWHFDDFSWGETRKVSGGEGKGGHGDKEGEFDSTHIVMKRWAEFERERRWKSGTQSRDSAYYDKGSPKRYSLVSNTDTGVTAGQSYDRSYDNSTTESHAAYPRHRADSNQLLSLPAPLGVRPTGAALTPSATRSSEDVYGSDGSSAHQRLISSPASPESEEPYSAGRSSDAYSPRSLEHHVSRTGGALRSGVAMSAYPAETTGEHSYGQQYRPQQRGVSLTDSGPVPPPGGEAVRRVARPRRQSTQPATQQQQNRYSRGSVYAGGLPPGAQAPNPGSYGGGYGV